MLAAIVLRYPTHLLPSSICSLLYPSHTQTAAPNQLAVERPPGDAQVWPIPPLIEVACQGRASDLVNDSQDLEIMPKTFGGARKVTTSIQKPVTRDDRILIVCGKSPENTKRKSTLINVLWQI